MILVQVTTAFTTEARQERGSENARSLIELGQIVFIGACDPARGHTVAAEIDTHFVQIEVIDDESVAATAAYPRATRRLERCIDQQRAR